MTMSTPLTERQQMLEDLAELREDVNREAMVKGHAETGGRVEHENDVAALAALTALHLVLLDHEPVPGRPKYRDDPRQCACHSSWWRDCPKTVAIRDALIDAGFDY